MIYKSDFVQAKIRQKLKKSNILLIIFNKFFQKVGKRKFAAIGRGKAYLSIGCIVQYARRIPSAVF